MNDRKKLVKKIKSNQKVVMNILEDSLAQAKELVAKIKWGKSPQAVVSLTQIIFSINMQTKKQLSQVDQVLAMAKARVEAMQKQLQEKNKTQKVSPS